MLNNTQFPCYVVTAMAHQDCKKLVKPGEKIRFDTARVFYTLQMIPDGKVKNWPGMKESYVGPSGTVGQGVAWFIDHAESFQHEIEAEVNGSEVKGTWKAGVYSHENGNYQTIKSKVEGGVHKLYLPDGKYGGPYP